MHPGDYDVADIAQVSETGQVLADARIDELLDAAYRRALTHREGTVADYIPILGRADPDAFGVSVVDVDGGIHAVGDTTTRFSIQSISKVGQRLYVEVDFIVAPGEWSVDEEDAVQRAITTRLGTLDHRVWATVELTSDPTLASDGDAIDP